MTDATPRVSVIIPTYNRADVIGNAIASCAAAGERLPLEAIVVDDGSTDDTRGAVDALVTELGDRHAGLTVHYIRQANQGACVARNRGLEAARGEAVKFLDSDDYLLPDALPRELEALNEAHADAVVTGWIEVQVRDGEEIAETRRVRSAPEMARGVDDMLLGRAPWTAAALYRTEFVKPLSWDPAWFKAQDWAWAWRVCLAGARFARLDIPSAVYCSHVGAERITGQAQAFLRSTEARQDILRMVEETLREQGRLTEPRRRRLAQYCYRDSKVLAEHDPAAWRALWRRCRALYPGFRPVEHTRFAKPFVWLLGGYWGSRAYVAVRRVARRLLGREDDT